MKRIRRVLLAIFLVVCAVYVSNIVSAAIITLRIANTVKRGINHRLLYVLPSDHSLGSPALTVAIFRTVGASVKRYPRSIDQHFDGFPWAEIGVPNVVVPFQVTVRWGFCDAPLACVGYRTQCWCIFGVVLSRDDVTTWVS